MRDRAVALRVEPLSKAQRLAPSGVHHKRLLSLDGQSMATELQAAIEASPGSTPRNVDDHAGEFVNRDVAAAIKAHNLIDS